MRLFLTRNHQSLTPRLWSSQSVAGGKPRWNILAEFQKAARAIGAMTGMTLLVGKAEAYEPCGPSRLLAPAEKNLRHPLGGDCQAVRSLHMPEDFPDIKLWSTLSKIPEILAVGFRRSGSRFLTV